MAQAVQNTDFLQPSADSSMNEETGGKTSFMTKIKNKTKDGTKKLKTKLKPDSKDEGKDENRTSSSSSSSSEDEAEIPKTQPYNNTEDPLYQPPAEVEPKAEYQASSDTPGTNDGESFQSRGFEAQKDDSGLSKEFAGLSTKETDEHTGQYDSGLSTDAKFNSQQPTYNSENKDEKSSSESFADDVSSAKDVAVDTAVGTAAAAGVTETSSPSGKSEDSGKSWSQWAAEKVGYGKDNVSPKSPTSTSTDTSPTETLPQGEKTDTQKAYDVAVQAKDTIHQQAVKPVYDKVIGAKDAGAEKISTTTESGSTPSDAPQQTYMQKATTGIYAAKDSLITSTHPGEADKALSQKVTETVGNLPATIKSSLGFGGTKSPTSTSPSQASSEKAENVPPTGEGDKALSQKMVETVGNLPATIKSSLGFGGSKSPTSPTPAASEEVEGAPPQSPGIVSRFTSLLGGAKKPTDTTASETAPETTSDTKMSEATSE